MECDTALPAEVDAWMSANGATYPAIAGLDAHNYWKNNWQPLLGGQFNQCIGIFPTAFTSPQTCYLDFIHIGLMTASEQQSLIDKLHQYGFYAGLETLPAGHDTLALWPNPATDRLESFVSGISADIRYQVIDIGGRIVATGVYSASIDITGLEAGMYFLKVSGEGKSLMNMFIKR
jgi:hypothetical protein